MKKIISTVAALGLVVGVAGTASALDLTVSGKYVLEGYMMSGADGSNTLDSAGRAYGIVMDAVTGVLYNHTTNNTANIGGFDPYYDETGTDSAWVHTFIVNPQLKVNDKISMFSELRFAKDTDWGTDNNSGNTGKSSADLFGSDQSTMDVYLLYMEYLSPVGKIRAGRVATGSWGGDFISSASHGDRFMWWPSFVADPFSLCVYTEKKVENDWYTNADDADNDVYEIDLTYKTDDLLLRGAYDYNNFKSNSTFDRQDSRLKAYGVAKIENFTIEGEWGWQFGDWRDYDSSALEDQDVDAMAFMLDATGKFDKLSVGMMYFWAEGQSDTDLDADMEAAMRGALDDGIGDDFNPYYILTGDHTGMLNSDEYNADPLMAISGVNAIGVHSDFQVSDQLTLHGAVGYAWADDTAVAELGIPSVDDEYGWEVDLGAKYKLLDNLTYEVRAGYFNTGDFFDDIATALGQDSDDVYLLSHHLTMTF